MTEQKLITNQEKPRKKHLVHVLIAAGIFLLIGLVFFAYWWGWGRFFESTTDAYVSGNKIAVNAQTTGNITGIYADDTEFVVQGQLLVSLDETDAQLKLQLSKDKLAETLREVVKLFAEVKEKKSEIVIKTADYLMAKEEYERRLNLVEIGGVSQEDTQIFETRLIAAEEEIKVAEYQYETLLAEVQNTTVTTHPRVQAAKDQLKIDWINLRRCKIKSPATGLIAQRSAQVGNYVSKDTPLLAVIPMEEMWVEANFKEVQLKKMRIGQNVKMTADMYGSDVEFQGKLIGIGGGTGSVFSLLPPQNATGNWIKIVQRLPVRIGINPKQLQQFPLRLGLSMDVTVDLQSGAGPIIPSAIEQALLYQTHVFEEQEEGVEEVINQIIQENVDPSLSYLEGLQDENSDE